MVNLDEPVETSRGSKWTWYQLNMNSSLLLCIMGTYYLVTHWLISEPTCSVPLLVLVLSILISPSENLNLCLLSSSLSLSFLQIYFYHPLTPKHLQKICTFVEKLTKVSVQHQCIQRKSERYTSSPHFFRT